MSIAQHSLARFMFDDPEATPMFVASIVNGSAYLVGRDWESRAFNATSPVACLVPYVQPTKSVGATAPAPTVGDMHGGDGRGQQQGFHGGPDFHGDLHYHDYHGNFNPWGMIAPAVIGGLIGQQIQQQEQAARTAKRPIMNPITGIEELRDPGYWTPGPNGPVYLPLACWMN